MGLDALRSSDRVEEGGVKWVKMDAEEFGVSQIRGFFDDYLVLSRVHGWAFAISLQLRFSPAMPSTGDGIE